MKKKFHIILINLAFVLVDADVVCPLVWFDVTLNWIGIGSDNGLSPIQRQAII